MDEIKENEQIIYISLDDSGKLNKSRVRNTKQRI